MAEETKQFGELPGTTPPPTETKAHMFVQITLDTINTLLDSKTMQLETDDRHRLQKDKLWLEKQLSEMKPPSAPDQGLPEPEPNVA